MSNFCGKCRAQIIDGVCPNCNPAPAVTDAEPEVLVKQKKTRKKLSIIIIAIVLVVAVAVAGVFIFVKPSIGDEKNGGHSTLNGKKSLAIQYNGNDYYISLGMTRLTEGEEIYRVKAADSERSFMPEIFLHIAFDGECFYGRDFDAVDGLYKFSFKDDDTVTKEMWVSEDNVKSAFGMKSDEYGVVNLRSFTESGDYVYALFYPDADRYNVYKNYGRNIAKISKSSGEIEVLRDINAASFIISGDRIYFYNNGYYNDESDKRGGVEGIYSADLNGGSVTKLCSFDSESTSLATGAGDMAVIGDKVYYIENSSHDGGGYITSVSVNGSKPERVSKTKSNFFTVDYDNDVIYYTGNVDDRSEWPSLYKLSLNDGTEEEIIHGILSSSYSYFNNCLYMYSNNYQPNRVNVNEEEDRQLKRGGSIYHLDTNTYDTLYFVSYYETKYDPATESFKTKEKGEKNYVVRNQTIEEGAGFY